MLWRALLQGPRRFKPAGLNPATGVAKMDGAGRCVETMANGAGHLKPKRETRTGRVAPIGDSAAKMTLVEGIATAMTRSPSRPGFGC